jgi:hypothetical protein
MERGKCEARMMIFIIDEAVRGGRHRLEIVKYQSTEIQFFQKLQHNCCDTSSVEQEAVVEAGGDGFGLF